MKKPLSLLSTICLAILFSSVLAIAQPTISISVINQPCVLNDGSMQIDVTGLTPPLNCTVWTGFGAVQFTDIATTSFVVDELPSAYYTQVWEVANPQMIVTDQFDMWPPFNVDYPDPELPICPDTEGTIELFINNGQSPSAVTWYEYGEPDLGDFVTSDNPASLTVDQAYAAIVEDGSGCSVLQTLGTEGQSDSIFFHAITDIFATLITTEANCTDGSITLDAITGGTAPYTYEWSTGATTTSIDNLSAGYYNLGVTDADGCTDHTWAYVPQGVNITVQTDVTNSTCLESDGAIMAFGSGGQSPYTYEWSDGTLGQLNEGLAGGTSYQVHVTDADGCSRSQWTYIGVATPITATFSSTASSCSTPNGTATVSIAGGTPPYTVTWNTFPAQTGVTATDLAPGNYGFTITDDVGCVRTGSVSVDPESTINAHLNAVHAVCPSNTGAIHASVSGTHPPFTYLWSDGSTGASIDPAPTGSYSCVITDDIGCSVTKYRSVNSASPVNLGVSSVPVSCVYSCDGSAFANASGGTAPYTYNWSNGNTSQNNTGLCMGYSSVTVTDADGCTDYYHYTIGNSGTEDDCYCTITGTVFHDENDNCTMDAGEEPMENVQIHCAGFGYAYTNENGVYSFQVPAGSYTINQTVQAFYPLASCQGNSFDINIPSTSSGCEHIVDFANAINPIRDIHVLTTFYGDPPVPGHDYTLRRIVSNHGTVDESAVIAGLEDDGQLGEPTFSPYAHTQLNGFDLPNWHSTSSPLELEAGETENMFATFPVPTNIPAATELVFDDTATFEAPMSTYLDDYSPWNNTNHYTSVVVSSYDPNMVEVLPQGEGEEGFIFTEDSVLDYIVHFQNTGTWYAENVVIKMTLDEDVQVETFIPGHSDDEYTVTIDENREVTWTFANINLPYQSQGEFISRGMVAFSIKQNPGLAPLTEIDATAAIYFDYNPPVITNTARNTIFEPTSIQGIEGEFSLLVYPNPSNGIFNAKLPAEAGSVVNATVFDMTGRTVLSTSSISQIDLSSADNGHYVLVVNTETGIYRQKLVVRK